MKKTVNRLLSVALVIMLLTPVVSHALGTTGGAITSHEFLMSYFARLSALGIDYRTALLLDSEELVMIGGTSLKIDAEHRIQTAAFMLDTAENNEEAACYLLAFIYAFKSSPGTDKLAESMKQDPYPDYAQIVAKILRATEQSPYIIGKYHFYTVPADSPTMILASLHE